MNDRVFQYLDSLASYLHGKAAPAPAGLGEWPIVFFWDTSRPARTEPKLGGIGRKEFFADSAIRRPFACPSGAFSVGIGVCSIGDRRECAPRPFNVRNPRQDRPVHMVSEPLENALLPAGITDELPPHAAAEMAALEKVMTALTAHGYERVKPPLVEFEESLMAGLGDAVTHQTFRLMDPISQRMMGLRADITPQISRIAATRMAHAPRPLRLSYAGQVVRVKGSQLRPERQFTQVGAELIGTAAAAADAETICLAAESLSLLGIDHISVDLCMPTMVPTICKSFSDDGPLMSRVREALDRKDGAGIANMAADIGEDVSKILTAMMSATGAADTALVALANLELDAETARQRNLLADVIATIRARNGDIELTVDPVENRGFEYHSGVTYTLFSRGVRGELGRGGRYQAAAGNTQEQPSTGFSLFMDTVMRALAADIPNARLFVPHGTNPAEAKRRRVEGWIVVEGLAPVADDAAEARRLNCSHLAMADGIEELSQPDGD